ncbi:MAG: saccharopine dehydrogenase NADP-binding domain-containing protein [Bacteroidota bacterium]|nr:MAG: saccharopine dehydrogenase NADP-binding domain-containing protein [Bacteroidota bacterium]
MKTILIIGAGRSSSTLIQYLEAQGGIYNWQLRVADKDIDLVLQKIHEPTRAVELDIFNPQQLEQEILEVDIVVSMLPARFHPEVARYCLKHGKSLLTASYESKEVADMSAEARSKGILFMNELGVDPGIDHMSAMREIDRIRDAGYKLHTFESFTGGLIAPESDNNPWHYKFTWNPRNVVVAGQGGPAKFIQEGKYKYIPYNRLFRRTEKIEVEGYGTFEGYANRDSLHYIEQYNLKDVATVYRGTLRRPGFCRAWDVFVQLGATDDSYIMENTDTMTYKEFINSFLYYSETDSVKLKLLHYMHLDNDSDIIDKLEWLGIFDNTPVGLKNATPAQILQHILSQKWELDENDKDMLVMWHKFIYFDPSKPKPILKTSSMGCIGDNMQHTAMSKTVGLPLAIATKMVLIGQINLKGVHIPTKKEIYDPILNELEGHGIKFVEKIYH